MNLTNAVATARLTNNEFNKAVAIATPVMNLTNAGSDSDVECYLPVACQLASIDCSNFFF